MARSVDVYADVLDDQGAWQRVKLRIRSDVGHFAGVRDLDYIGKVESLQGGLVGMGASPDSRDRKDAPLPEWLKRLTARMKGAA